MQKASTSCLFFSPLFLLELFSWSDKGNAPRSSWITRAEGLRNFYFFVPSSVWRSHYRGSTTSFSIVARITIGKASARARYWLARETGDLWGSCRGKALVWHHSCIFLITGVKVISFLKPAKCRELVGRTWTAGGVLEFLWYGAPVCGNNDCAITRTQVPGPVSLCPSCCCL